MIMFEFDLSSFSKYYSFLALEANIPHPFCLVDSKQNPANKHNPCGGQTHHIVKWDFRDSGHHLTDKCPI